MHPSSQRLLTIEAPRTARLVDRPLARPGPGDVVIRSLYSTFKHGTEMMAYLGRTPFASRVFDSTLRLFETAPAQAAFYPRPMGSMFGLIFLVLAVLCEYLAEMRSEVKRRPLYVVQGEVQSNVMLANAETRNVVSHEEKVETVARPSERAKP